MGTARPAPAENDESLATGTLCTFVGTKYGDTQRHTGTEISPEMRGHVAHLQQRADDYTPASPGSAHRSRRGGDVIQGVGGPDPSGRDCHRWRAFYSTP